MSDKKPTSPATPKKVYFKDSATIPNMQVAPEAKRSTTASAEIPKMQLAPGTTVPQDKSASPSDGKGSKESKE